MDSQGRRVRKSGGIFLVLAACVAARIIIGSACGGEVWYPDIAGAASKLFGGISAGAALGILLAAVCAALAVCARLLAVPRMREVPRGAQGLLEAVVAAFTALERGAGRCKRALMKAGAKMKSLAAKKIAARIGIAAAVCAATGVALGRIFPHSGGHELSVSMSAPDVSFFGYSIPGSIVFTWYIMLALAVTGLVLRVVVLPRFKDRPVGVQNVLETAVEACESFTKSHVHGIGGTLSSYVFAVVCYLVASASIELVGLRPPTSDVTVTFALSAITFAMINFYGLKANGLKGRARQFVSPRAFMAPFKLLSDISIPISLACRLFGNMLGGMIVMNLIYMALGSFAVGIPAVLGLYFNLFHPLIQTFIFIKLSLSFIEEAVD